MADPRTGSFPETRWTLVAQVRAGGEAGQAALAELCARYWYPIYAFLRRRGQPPPDAEDLTQGFFLRLLRDDLLHGVDAARGRLRTYLLAAVERHVADHFRHEHAAKRGGGTRPLPIEWETAETRYCAEPADPNDPEKLFAASWARALLERARDRLRAAFIAQGRAETFAALEPHLAWNETRGDYPALAARLGSTEGAVRVMVHRLREKFRALLEDEVAQTVASPEEVASELAWLRAALS